MGISAATRQGGKGIILRDRVARVAPNHLEKGEQRKDLVVNEAGHSRLLEAVAPNGRRRTLRISSSKQVAELLGGRGKHARGADSAGAWTPRTFSHPYVNDRIGLSRAGLQERKETCTPMDASIRQERAQSSSGRI